MGRRMGNLGQHLGNTTPTTSLHYQLSELWRSHRGTVVRIEALALVAIALSFFLAIFGSCRRWSNRWIVQKGFLTAQVLSLSLGTYSIGLMQASSVKSEMYPIWSVSLLTLFGCVDPVTTYVGLDYKGPLLKMIFQICLYCGYILVISGSTISGTVGNLAIGVLCAITFIKCFHRSLALVLPSTTRGEIEELVSKETNALLRPDEGLKVHLPMYLEGILEKVDGSDCATMVDIHNHMGELQLAAVSDNDLTIEDVCLGYSLSHLLQRHFLGLSNSKEEMEEKIKVFKSLVGGDGCPGINYTRTLKVIEVELAFVYEVFFSSNEFLHLYQAKTGSFWAFSSFIGICFVGAAVAIPGAIASHHRVTSSTTSTCPSPTGGTVIVSTTIADLLITIFILACLALLQLVQLMRCWTSNWARVAFACEYARNRREQMLGEAQLSLWMRLRAFVVTRINWFDKYLWQDKLGQYSLVDSASSRSQRFWDCFGSLFSTCKRSLVRTGAAYILVALWELLAIDADRVAAVGLHDDVKTFVVRFLGHIKNRRIGVEWSSLFVENGLDPSYLPYNNTPLKLQLWGTTTTTMSEAYAFMHRVMVWHIATCYCELAEQEEQDQHALLSKHSKKNRRVAIDLSKYCAYLVVSAPQLLPGPSAETKRALQRAALCTRAAMDRESNGLSAMRQVFVDYSEAKIIGNPFRKGVYLGRLLRNEEPPPPDQCCMRRPCSDPWEVLALLWVQTLLYAAPSGDVAAHMQHLSHGGEFITHLWALLYHLGIDKWEHDEEAQDR